MPLWQTWLADKPPISWPCSSIDPAVGGYMPAMQLKVVLLPEPFGPMRPKISPSLTSKDTLETAVKPPNVLVRPETVRSATEPALCLRGRGGAQRGLPNSVGAFSARRHAPL